MTLFGIVYIPPEGSQYSSPDAFSEIEAEYLNLSCEYKYICFNGDFNSRVSNFDDFLPDDELSDIELNIIGINNCDKLSQLNAVKLRKNRVSKDGKKNNFGNYFLDFFKCNNLFILNGRIGQDKDIGNFTTVKSTIIDYFVG